MAFEFSFGLKKRYLVFVRKSVEWFLANNPNFRCDVFYVKDFAGTSSDITHDMVLPHLKMNGLYVSNALTAFDVPFMPLFGLRFARKTAIVGFSEMYVFQKRTPMIGSAVQRQLGRLDSAQRRAVTYFGDNDDKYDFLSGSYEALRPHETQILSEALECVRLILDDGTLSNGDLYEMCVACVRKGSWVGAWMLGAAWLNEGVYQAAWARRHLAQQAHVAMSRPAPPSGRRPPSRLLFAKK